jgi:lantibiotic modifying enzyme
MKYVLSIGLLLLTLQDMAGPGTVRYWQQVTGAMDWLKATGVHDKDGTVWASDPADPKTVGTTLYSGTPGPILFLLEASRYVPKNQELVAEARSGADALLSSIKKEDGAGLYEGLSGPGFTLGEMYLVTHEQKYLDGAMQVVKWLQEKAIKTDAGVKWSDTTDIIAGNSGTGLFLLWADENLHAAGAKELATRAGEDLLKVGIPQEGGGLKWMMDPTFPREMPNFSHGTAGVAYFLATLYQKTGKKEFLDGAQAGARYLLSIKEKDPKVCMIYHDSTPAGKSLFYLSWCHGPAGTSRLFYRLHQITKDPKWMAEMKKAAQAIADADGNVVKPGSWHNLSMCCGTAGQSQFFLDMYAVTKDRQYLELAKKTSDRLWGQFQQDNDGIRWVQAETRVKPEVEIAQTGFMQGASGIGMELLHLTAAIRGNTTRAIVFPDNPFPY